MDRTPGLLVATLGQLHVKPGEGQLSRCQSSEAKHTRCQAWCHLGPTGQGDQRLPKFKALE